MKNYADSWAQACSIICQIRENYLDTEFQKLSFLSTAEQTK